MQNKNDYLKEEWRQLRKYKIYEKMDSDLTNDHRIKIQELDS